MRQLLLLPKYDDQEYREDPEEYPDLVGQRALIGSNDASTSLRDHLRPLSPPWMQVLASANTAEAYKTRPLKIDLVAQKDYDRLFKQNVVFFVRLFNKCYGENFDIEKDPNFENARPLEQGLERVMKAFIASDKKFKSLVHDVLSASVDVAYWRFGHYLVTTSVPAKAKSSLLHLLLATHAIVTPVNGDFKSAVEFTPTLSRIIYMAKICWAGEQLDELRNDLDNPIADAALGAQSPDDIVARRFQERHAEVFGESSIFISGYPVLLSLRALGMRIAAAEKTRARVCWAQGGDAVRVDGKVLKLSTYGSFLNTLIDKSEEALKHLLSPCSGRLDTHAMPYDQLTDDPANDSPGFWFGELPENKELFDPNTYGNVILPALFELENEDANANPKVKPDWASVDDYLNMEKLFLKVLAVTILLTSDMPCRHKSEWATKVLRHNIHVTHPDVGRLLVAKTARKTQKWDTTINGRELEGLSAAIMGLELSISANRQFAEAIAHEKFQTGGMREQVKNWIMATAKPSDPDDLVEGHHSTHAELGTYGSVSVFKSSRLQHRGNRRPGHALLE
ncbi:hypothetical protein V8E36_007522 [Tilletia maclaganii]